MECGPFHRFTPEGPSSELPANYWSHLASLSPIADEPLPPHPQLLFPFIHPRPCLLQDSSQRAPLQANTNAAHTSCASFPGSCSALTGLALIFSFFIHRSSLFLHFYLWYLCVGSCCGNKTHKHCGGRQEVLRNHNGVTAALSSRSSSDSLFFLSLSFCPSRRACYYP